MLEEEKSRRPRHEWDGKSLTHRLDLSGVVTPSPRKGNGRPQRPPRPQKRAESGDKKTEREHKAPNSNVHKEKDMDPKFEINEEKIASAVAGGLGEALKGFKGVDIKVVTHTGGWKEEALSYGSRGLIVAGTLAAGTAAVLGVARLFGYKPGAIVTPTA